MAQLEFELAQPTAAELDVLYPIYRACYLDYVRATWGEWDEEWQRQRFYEGFPLSRAKTITVEGRVIGAVDMERRQDSWWLNNIEIAPEWQGRGIGTALLVSLLDLARADGVPVNLACLRVNPALRLYERMGFAVIGETETHYLMRVEPMSARR